MNKNYKKIIILIFIFLHTIILSACSINNYLNSSAQANENIPESQTTSETYLPLDTEEASTTDVLLGLTDGTAHIDATGKPEIESKSTKLLDGKNEEINGNSIASTEQNKSAVKVLNGGLLSLKNLQLVTSNETSSDLESRFYGLNSGVLIYPRSKIIMDNCEIVTNGKGSSGAFSYGNNSVVNMTNSKITTSGADSKGIAVAFNGNAYASQCIVTTNGESSPALYIARNGGTINAVGGSFLTKGASSPALYSCGNLSVTGSDVSSDISECAVIEGKSSLSLTGAKLKAGGANGIRLFQSNSGDVTPGTTSLNITGGNISTSSGAMFYITNTNAEINIQNATLDNGSSTLLSAVSDKWGEKGKNGGNVKFFAQFQKMTGDVYADNVSTVDFRILSGSDFKGAINTQNTAKEVYVTIDATSIWTMTGDSYVTAITNNFEGLKNIKDNGYTIYYDPSKGGNKWLNGRTLSLQNGGKITPIQTVEQSEVTQ